jgi:outer membrane protein TolC
MKRCFVSSVVALLVSASAAAAFDLSLEQALQSALDHAHSLKSARSQQDASLHALATARAERWPTLSVTGVAYLVDDVPTINLGLPGGRRWNGSWGRRTPTALTSG